METASRAEEGCLDYTFSIELSDPAVIRITDKWATVEALKAHFNTPHMAEFQARSCGSCPAPSRADPGRNHSTRKGMLAWAALPDSSRT